MTTHYVEDGAMKDGEKWVVIEQPCGCCGVKNKDGKVWGYPMVRGAAEAVVDFANREGK